MKKSSCLAAIIVIILLVLVSSVATDIIKTPSGELISDLIYGKEHDISLLPEYTDKPYDEINNNIPYFPPLGKDILSELDSYEYYSPSYIDKATNISALTNIKKVVIDCRSFIENFDSRNPNLFLYGSTGVGKTFLTNCIAKELLDRYHSVIYLSAIQLFDLLAEESFSRNNNSSFTDDILNCDLLIIDDLGTELNNSFTISALFNCLNERLLRKHSTIISSNLSLEDLQNQYNERLFSRIIGNYKTLKIFGEDIRFLKRN